jgi:membrane protease YdiL (CAAX protease family)
MVSRGTERPALWMAGAAVLLGLAAGIFSTLLVEIIGAALGGSLNHPSPAVSLTADFVFDLSFVGAALYFSVLQGRMGRAAFGYRLISWRLGVTVLVVAGVGYYAVTYAYGALLSLHGTDKLPSELGANHSTAALVTAAIFVCAFAPMAEEFFFRGFLFGVLRRMRVNVAGRELGPWVAAVIVGLLFGLAHTGSASSQYLVPLGFLGFVLCLMRWRTGSLYPCMALHAFNNALALGVNQLHWSAVGVAGLILASLAVVALVSVPLAARPAAASSTLAP